VSDEISEVDMSDSDADATNYQQEDLLNTIAQLEQRLRGAQTRIDSYQNERNELLTRMIRLKSRSIELESRLQKVVDLLEK
jgi:chromosome segregation ATPase